MHDRRNNRSDRGRSRHDHDGERRRRGGERHDRGRGDDCGGERESGPDTRFLQLEMSEVLYSEAESVTKQAFRELLLEAAKARFRERFGDQISGLAQLAVDELMRDVLASLDVEATIRQRNREQEARRERLSGILGAGRGGAPEEDREACSGESPEPDGEDSGSDEDR
jgi:hypothetical protein